MLGLDPRLQAIIEIVLLLILAAFIGWLLGRLALSGQRRLVRMAVADKEAELEECRSGTASGPTTPDHLLAASASVTDLTEQEPPAFVHADPLLPALTYDDTPEPINVEAAVPTSLAGGPADAPVFLEPAVPVDLKALAGNSEAAVLNRIAARASEVNFDRIGRATATEADDLKDIVGVGPFLERKLHSLGIYTFRQVGNFTKEDITKVNELIEFFPGRIERDNWVDQAKEFYERKYGNKSRS